MRRREMKYSDYSMSPELVKELKDRCRRLGPEDQITLLLCAIKANEGIAPALWYSLISGASWERLDSISPIPLPKGDFYAYRRHCLALLSAHLHE